MPVTPFAAFANMWSKLTKPSHPRAFARWRASAKSRPPLIQSHPVEACAMIAGSSSVTRGKPPKAARAAPN